MNHLTLVASLALQLLTLITAAGARASYRVLEFFTAQIRNPHTRRAYARGGRILRLARGARRRAVSQVSSSSEDGRSAERAIRGYRIRTLKLDALSVCRA